MYKVLLLIKASKYQIESLYTIQTVGSKLSFFFPLQQSALDNLDIFPRETQPYSVKLLTNLLNLAYRFQPEIHCVWDWRKKRYLLSEVNN